MKNVLMTLFFLCGLATTQVFAQTCQPCPPACAKICKDKTKCSAAEMKACQAAVATCTPAEVEACKAAAASCITETGSAQTASFTGPVQSASCNTTSNVQVATCMPDTKSAKTEPAQDLTRRKTAKAVAIRG